MDRRRFVTAYAMAWAPMSKALAQAQVPTPRMWHMRQAISSRHASVYLEAGPADGTPVILLHGWPEIALAWRHVIPALASQGLRVIAPDLRGCGGSTVHAGHAAYAQREIVADMLELADAAGVQRAVWVGHDCH